MLQCSVTSFISLSDENHLFSLVGFNIPLVVSGLFSRPHSARVLARFLMCELYFKIYLHCILCLGTPYMFYMFLKVFM